MDVFEWVIKSRTVQGIVIAVVGGVIDTLVQQGLLPPGWLDLFSDLLQLLGLGWAGIGARRAIGRIAPALLAAMLTMGCATTGSGDLQRQCYGVGEGVAATLRGVYSWLRSPDGMSADPEVRDALKLAAVSLDGAMDTAEPLCRRGDEDSVLPILRSISAAQVALNEALATAIVQSQGKD